MSIKKAITQIHLWLGLASGLVVLILGLTGAIYTFSNEIKAVVYKERLYVVAPQHQQKLSLDTLLSIAQKAIGEKHKISRIEISQQPDRTYMFRALKLNKKGFGYWNYYTYYFKVYLNPYNGKVIFKENAKNEFFTIVLALHMNLLLGDGLGHQLVKWSTICFVILLLSGLVLWWPKRWKKKQLKKSFAIKWKAKFKRLNYDLHNVLGFYSLLFLLVIALTGLAWSFELTTEKKAQILSDTLQPMKTMPAGYIIAQSLEKAPNTAYFLYNLPATKSGTVNISAYQSETQLYNRIQYKFDRYNGRILQEGKPFSTQETSAKLISLNYDLHTGSALGLTGKIIALMVSLISAMLPITGLIIWLKKKKKVSVNVMANQSPEGELP